MWIDGLEPSKAEPTRSIKHQASDVGGGSRRRLRFRTVRTDETFRNKTLILELTLSEDRAALPPKTKRRFATSWFTELEGLSTFDRYSNIMT